MSKVTKIAAGAQGATCLRPECARAARHRGLCSTDYSAAARLVREGRASWDDLMAAGRVLPARAYGTSIDWLLGKGGPAA